MAEIEGGLRCSCEDGACKTFSTGIRWDKDLEVAALFSTWTTVGLWVFGKGMTMGSCLLAKVCGTQRLYAGEADSNLLVAS